MSERREIEARRRAEDPFGEGAAAARARRLRSVGIAVALVLFVLLIFAVSILKLAANMHAAHG